MKILAVIPARGGSKGIPKKNIYPLLGKPLLEYTLECAIKADVCEDIVVSTDSNEIMSIARNYKQIIIVPRPSDISGDAATTESALIHAINYLKNLYNKQYDAVMTLQATSPLRKVETIKTFIESYERNYDKYDAMLTLHENRIDHWVCDDNGKFERLYPNAPRRRQERKPLYMENSCIYITSVDSLLATKSVLGYRPNGFIISEEEGMDINEPIDIKIIEGIMGGNNP